MATTLPPSASSYRSSTAASSTIMNGDYGARNRGGPGPAQSGRGDARFTTSSSSSNPAPPPMNHHSPSSTQQQQHLPSTSSSNNGNPSSSHAAPSSSSSRHDQVSSASASVAAPAPPQLSLTLEREGQQQQTPTVLQILSIGRERTLAAQSAAHHPRIPSLIKLARESEMTWIQIGKLLRCHLLTLCDDHDMLIPLLSVIGATAESLGDWNRALTAYESALRHNSSSVLALTQVASIFRSKEEFAKAAEYFGRVVGIAPESGDVWGALGD